MIQLTQLGFHYNAKTRVFKGLNLDISEGRCVGVLGANGVGKTTLLKLISGLAQPSEGDIKVLGMTPRERSTALYQQLFLVPEEIDLPPISGSAFLKQFSVFYPHFDMALCQSMLSKFDVDASKVLTEMSLGQKKKFMVAVALSSGCKLILMDEPTNGLDIPSKARFRDIVVAHQADDQTVLICTHQVKDLEAIIDSVVLMNDSSAHWFDLGELPNKISQVVGSTNGAEALHTETRLGSQVSLVSGASSQPTDIDLELLFNTFHNNYGGLMSAINEDISR